MGAGKQNQYKFTLLFNENDPHQRKAAGLLNQQGRRKSSFLTEAILHYVTCTNQTTDPLAEGLATEELIAAVVKRTLAEMGGGHTAPSREAPPVQKRKAAIVELPDTDTLEEDDVELLGKGMAAFL